MFKYIIIIGLIFWGWGKYGEDIKTEIATWQLEQKQEKLTEDIIKLKSDLEAKVEEGTAKFNEVKDKLEAAQQAFQETKEALEKLNQATSELKESVGLEKATEEDAIDTSEKSAEKESAENNAVESSEESKEQDLNTEDSQLQDESRAPIK